MKIKELKNQLQASQARWTVSAQFSDDADVESLVQRRALGALTPPAGTATAHLARIRRSPAAGIAVWQPGVARQLRKVAAALPGAWDWRNANGQNWVTSIKDQGGCGSCVAFAVCAALETIERIEHNNPNLAIDASEAELFFANDRQCLPQEPRYGWGVPSALDYLVAEGACYEQNYPYRPVDQEANLVLGTDHALKITGFDSSTQASQMKQWLVEEGPLVTAFTVYDDFFTYWFAGVHEDVYTHHTGDLAGGHAVAVVGYDDAKACWICKNSWGSVGAQGGFFKIGYGQCGIDSRMYLIEDAYDVVTVDEIPYTPKALRIVDEGARGWLLTDGRCRLQMFDNKEDARNGLAVARRYTRQGFVGRSNPRANRTEYITEYWAGNSGLPHQPLTQVDAIPYHPGNVVAENLDVNGWRIKDGNHWMLMATDLDDALAVLRIVERYTKLCFIGRNNHRPNRSDYIMTYWE